MKNTGLVLKLSADSGRVFYHISKTQNLRKDRLSIAATLFNTEKNTRCLCVNEVLLTLVVLSLAADCVCDQPSPKPPLACGPHPVADCWCVLRLQIQANLFPHWSQLKGFSPV